MTGAPNPATAAAPPRTRAARTTHGALLRMSVLTTLVLLLHALVGAALIEAWRSPGTLLFVGVAAALAAIVATALLADAVRRSAVLVRTLERFRAERVPPSPSALRDAVRAPYRVAGLVTLSGVLVSVLELASGGRLSGTDGADTWSCAYAWTGMALLSWTPVSFVVRAEMERWVRPYDPRELHKVGAEGLTARLAADLLFTLLGLLSAASAVYLSFVRGEAAIPAWFVPALAGAALVFLVVFPFVVWQTRRFERTIHSLARTVAAHRPGTLLTVTRGDVPLLAESLKRLEARYADTVRRETSTRLLSEDGRVERTQRMALLVHDWTTPLLALHATAERLLEEREGSLSEGQRTLATAVRDHARELLEVVSDILDIARLRLGKLPLDTQWTPPAEILTRAVSEAEPEAKRLLGVGVTLELEPGLPALLVDSTRVRAALAGVLKVLLRAPGQRALHVRAAHRRPAGAPAEDAAHADAAIEVRMRGTEPSFRVADHEGVFEPFSSPTFRTGEPLPGLGIGLALARSLARAHHGDLRVTVGEKNATEFVLTLPLGAARGKDTGDARGKERGSARNER